jgi:hypothetical protein
MHSESAQVCRDPPSTELFGNYSSGARAADAVEHKIALVRRGHYEAFE